MGIEIKNVPVSEIIPYENNPRKNEKAVFAVQKSIEQFGFKVPLVLDKENVVVAGHTRLKAAIEIGMETVPVIYADDLTDEQVRAFRLADNKTAELASWDNERLLQELEEITGIDMTAFQLYAESRFDADEFFTPDAQEKKEPEPKKVQCPHCGAWVEI